jgi:hypothetical protein
MIDEFIAGKRDGFGCLIGFELDYVCKMLDAAGVEYEPQADNPAEVWIARI